MPCLLLQLDTCSVAAMEALHLAWPVLLDHIIVTDPRPCSSLYRLVCSLLCVSRGMRSTVLAQAAGHLSLYLANWLAKEPQQKLSAFARSESLRVFRVCCAALILRWHCLSMRLTGS